MGDFRNVMKNGWHPKGKDGSSKESWRGDFKGINQVATWVGKGKSASDTAASTHVSRPLSTLKDPALFGPPPKNVHYHGGAALPNEITPVRTGLGAPLSQEEIQAGQTYTQQAATNANEPVEDEESKPAGPPLPYRQDRTGLETSHLPPPPVHVAIAHCSPEQQQQQQQQQPSQTAKPKPGLPPRLPARQNSTGISTPAPAAAAAAAAAAPPPYSTVASQPRQSTLSDPSNGILNSSAINRLGHAGVSVPCLGIGKTPTPGNVTSTTITTTTTTTASPKPATSSHSPQPALPAGAGSTFSELSNRFARMNSNSPTPPAAAPQTAPSQSQAPQPNAVPAWQQSQNTIRTASNFHKDPSSVSVADAKEAAQATGSAVRTANAFREKHADTLAAAGKRANAFDQKYKVKSRFTSFLDKHAPLEEPTPGQVPPQQQQQPVPSIQPSPSPEMMASISRKPPPPPPPKKPVGLSGSGVTAPPVPISTKPTF